MEARISHTITTPMCRKDDILSLLNETIRRHSQRL